MTGRIAADEAAAEAGGKGFLAFVLTTRGFVVIWGLYVLANLLIRYSLSTTLSTDDAPESLIVQVLRLGYDARHPPLWEWLLWTVQQAVGPGPASHFIMRYGCIFLFGVAIFRASRAVTGSVPWASAVGLSTPIVYQFGWPFFEWGTHTLLLAIVAIFTLEAAVRYAARPTSAAAALFGALIGLGFLAKWGFALILLALILAFLARRETRAALLRREMLLAAVVALIVFSPFLYWLIEAGTNVATMTHQTLVRSEASHLDRVLEGLNNFAQASLRTLVPWPIVLAIAVWEGRRRYTAPMAPAANGEWLAGLTLLFSIVITFCGILAFGVNRMTGGYVLPVLIMVLPWSAGLLARAAPGEIGPRRLATLGMTVLVIVSLLRLVYIGNSGFPPNHYRREMIPYAGLAEAMRKAGMDRGTLVTIGNRDGGNLRAELPAVRVVLYNQDESLRPSVASEGAGPCRLLWNDTPTLNPGERWARSREPGIAATLPQIAGRERQSFDIPWPPTYLGNSRIGRWTVVELDPDDPLCR